MQLMPPLLSFVLLLLVAHDANSAVVSSSSHPHPPPPTTIGTTVLHPKFRSQIRCPHADRWLTVGPEIASYELGMGDAYDEGRRRLMRPMEEEERGRGTANADANVNAEDNAKAIAGRGGRRRRRILSSSMSVDDPPMGSCTYANVFSGGDTCVQYHGGASSWTESTMTSRCDENGGALALGASGTCPLDDLAGWCVVNVDDVDVDAYESTSMTLSPASDCDGNEMACVTFVGGTFVPDGACSSSSSSGSTGGNDNLAIIKSETLRGSCIHSYDISIGMGCIEFRGDGWTIDSMTSRCDSMTDGNFVDGVGCAATDNDDDAMMDVAGWCDTIPSDGMHETSLMMLTDGADCAANEMVCKTLHGGIFGADGGCAANGANSTTSSSSSSSSSSSTSTSASSSTGGADDENYDGKCLLAPGAIGAAHQAGYSRGYTSTCPNTPGEGSPYMWPMSWSADYESRSMAYGTDDIMHTSRGRTFYMLDRNWKRSDTTYRKGLLRTIGQSPCENVDEDFTDQTSGFLGCRYNDTDGTVSTMIHRENLMYFITWRDADVDAGEDPVLPGETDASRIEECTYIDLVVIGNIRPDWFLDKRGDDTDTQYLGNQHVYYAADDNITVPRLVKQWRKKDFASQYFTMSMMGNPPNKLKQDPNASIEDNTHWPLILNIPGEGFGDDMLQVYRNHRLLDSEVDASLFEIIESYEAMGGVCTDIRANATSDDGANFGPPVLEEDEKIPSNLEVDPMSWFSNEYTFSPVWDSSSSSAVDQTPPSSSSSSDTFAMTEVSDRLIVESCADGLGSVQFSFYFRDVELTGDGLLPWMAIGYRASDTCAMTPTDGGSTPIVLLTQMEVGGVPVAHKMQLLPEAKGASETVIATMTASMVALVDEVEYSDVSVTATEFLSSASMASAMAVEVSRSSPSSLGEEEGTVSLHFKHTPVVDAPAVGDTMYYTYAIGTTSRLGNHETRGCFEIPVTLCGNGTSESGGQVGATIDEEDGTVIDLGDGMIAVSGEPAAPGAASSIVALFTALFVIAATSTW